MSRTARARLERVQLAAARRVEPYQRELTDIEIARRMAFLMYVAAVRPDEATPDHVAYARRLAHALQRAAPR
jgi:hypothetical protein